jgi:hypothetical protein
MDVLMFPVTKLLRDGFVVSTYVVLPLILLSALPSSQIRERDAFQSSATMRLFGTHHVRLSHTVMGES